MTDIILDRSMFGDETDVELVAWLVKDGDTVTAGQTIAELETGKATVEMTAPAGGIIKLLINPHNIVEVGSKIGIIT